MDEFRVSTVARYSAPSITEPGSPFPNNEASTALLWHLDEQGVRKLWQFNAPETHDFKGMFPDSSGNHHGMEFYSAPHCSISCDSQYRVYALGNGRTAAELDGNGSPWECPCTLSHTDWPVNSATGEFWHTFDDISVPGRGFGLDFSRTYSSLRASTLGPLGYGWSVKSEFLYVKFDNFTTFGAAPFTPLIVSPREVKLEDYIWRAGLNYKFW